MKVASPTSPKTVRVGPEGAWSLSRPRRVHLVGIAGNGMRALADVLRGWGWRLSGSDSSVAPVRALAAEGVPLFQGHHAENIPPETEAVVFSDAVSANNPEICRAAKLGIPISSYFQMLGQLGIGRHTLAIAGTHGKSTTTAMTARLLIGAGLDPTVVCGATPLGANSGGHAGRGEFMLVEACEYRANFLHLRPRHAAILNIEPDHFDYYDSLDQLEDAFRRFAFLVSDDGLLLIRHDCPSARRATAGLEKSRRIESFGLSSDAQWSARELRERGGRFQFEIFRFGRSLCEVRLPVPGLHNVLNALAAAALAWEHGVSANQISVGLAGFPGLHRRLEVLDTWRAAHQIDDYAHHPTEVTAALTTARRLFPHSRVWCVFQPHQVSRTQRLLDELAISLQNADKVLVAEIFRARESGPQPGEITAADLARKVAGLGTEVLPGHTAEEIVATLETQLAPDDVLVTLGAGDVGKFRPTEGRGSREKRALATSEFASRKLTDGTVGQNKPQRYAG